TVPLRAEHRAFLQRCLLPLLKRPQLGQCFCGLDACFRVLVEKDGALGVLIVEALLRYWPRGNMNKEIGFLFFLKTVVANTAPEQLQPVQKRIVRRLCDCSHSMHLLIVERSLELWDDVRFVENMRCNPDFGSLVAVLRENQQSYWFSELQDRFARVLDICNSR
ncbi:hypothetical protein WA577_002235, partial [Blastocystis sp. JDR]